MIQKNTMKYDSGHTHQHAFPIWTPACPIWMEMTSLIVIPDVSLRKAPSQKSNLAELEYADEQMESPYPTARSRKSCRFGNVPTCFRSSVSRQGAKERWQESPGEPGFRQNHCTLIWPVQCRNGVYAKIMVLLHLKFLLFILAHKQKEPRGASRKIPGNPVFAKPLQAAMTSPACRNGAYANLSFCFV